MIASIIIASRNRCADLRETMRALSVMQIPPGLRVELLVIDNGSTDATRELVESARFPAATIRYAYEGAPGKSSALNLGLKLSQGEMILFLDDDIRPAQTWLATITAPMVNGHKDAIGGAVHLAPHLLRPWMTKSHLGWLAATKHITPNNPEFFVGANMAISRRVLAKVPMFDPELGPGKLGLWEDVLFFEQMKRAGLRLAYVPEASVDHHFAPDRLTRSVFLSHAERQGRSAAYVAWHWHQASARGRIKDLVHYRARLSAKRLINFRELKRNEGIATWEMDLVSGIAFTKQLGVESQRPRKYSRGTA